MFTGIIESLGTIEHIEIADTGLRLAINLGDLEVEKISVGDSIAVNGACLTVTRLDALVAWFDVSTETLSKCLMGQWRAGKKLNLETALTLEKPLGGHLVSGHVDGVGTLVERRDGDESCWLQFCAPRRIGRFIAVKGSIAVDGVSLTSNNVTDRIIEGEEKTFFDLTLVPHTLSMTNLGNIQPDTSVHLEIDILARYLERMNESDTGAKRDYSANDDGR